VNEAPEPLSADPQVMQDWLTQHYGAIPPGLVAVCSTRNWTGIQTASIGEAVQWAMTEDRAGAKGIYVRVTTVTAPSKPGSRGSARDSHALIDMWSDLDFGDDGHKTTGLPKDADEAADIPTFAGLPPATETDHSGGGLYKRWILDRPAIIGKDIDLDDAVQLAADWQNIILLGAKKMGVGYGTGVKDTARVLRLVGTINGKDGRVPAMCRVVEDGGPRYSLEEMLQLAADLKPKPKKRTPPPAAAPSTCPPRQGRTKSDRAGPIEILGEHPVCGEILSHAGCTYHQQEPGTCSYCGADCQQWLRPGWAPGASTTGIAVHKGGTAVTVRTDNFPGFDPGSVGRVLSPGQLFAALHHHGDLSVAAQDILRAAHDRPEATAAARALPATVLGGIRQASVRSTVGAPVRQTATGVPQPRTYVHPAKRLRALVTKVAAASGEDAAGLLRWAARNGFTAGQEASVEPRVVADAFRKAAIRAGLDNDLAMTIIRTSYREAGK
jgi:hypothetical protein